MGKIQAGKPVGGTQFGTTITNGSTHAPTLKGSSTSPKSKIGVNGIVSNSPQGTTFQGNKSDISQPSRPPALKTTKVAKSGSGSDFVPKGQGIKYGSGGNGPSVKNPPVKGR